MSGDPYRCDLSPNETESSLRHDRPPPKELSFTARYAVPLHERSRILPVPEA